jgi:hypothetical protein
MRLREVILRLTTDRRHPTRDSSVQVPVRNERWHVRHRAALRAAHAAQRGATSSTEGRGGQVLIVAGRINRKLRILLRTAVRFLLAV